MILNALPSWNITSHKYYFFHVQACCIGNLSRLYSVIFDIKFENQCALQQNYLLETIQNGDCRKGEKVYKILAGYYSRLNFAYFL